MQARFYAPWYGRFLSPDPARDQHFEETQSWNIYSYVQNNPTLHFDPNGEADIFVFRPEATKTSAAWNKTMKVAERNGNTVHMYNGPKATVENYNKALATPDAHVVVTGHTVENEESKAVSVHLADGDVGTRAAAISTAPSTPVGDVQATTVGAFGCSSVDLAPQYSNTTFTGVTSGSDHVTDVTTLDASARAYTNVLAKDGSPAAATAAATKPIKASNYTMDHNGDKAVIVPKKADVPKKKED